MLNIRPSNTMSEPQLRSGTECRRLLFLGRLEASRALRVALNLL